MKSLVNVLISAIFLLSQTLLAGGYAGNGGGLVEQNFNFVYSSLPRLIESSAAMITNQFSNAELATLLKIGEIAQQNSSNSKRLLFLSGQKHPEIFNTSEEELHRLAVTTLNPGDTIFVNSDLLYTDQGTPMLTIGEIVSILVHEVGHQTGEKDHQYLDIIGSKLRNYYNQNSLNYDIIKGDTLIVFSVINQRGLYTSGQLIFQNQTGVVDLTPKIIQKILMKMESKKYQNLTGFFLTNGNYKLEKLPERYIFQIWVNANFSVITNDGINSQSELFPIEFEINADNSVKNIDEEPKTSF